jgi:septum formation protein
MKALLLASASPRRRELLAQLGIEFTTTTTDLDEIPLPGESPRQLVHRLALAKARAARAKAEPGQWILGADTVVALDQKILGKPASAGDADAMLQCLSGRSHRVYTGIALLQVSGEHHPTDNPAPDTESGATHLEILHTRVVCTKVWMRDISASERHAYIATGEPMGKAGAYAIQGRATIFIRCIVGSYTNVVGLPLYELAGLLEGLTPRSAECRAQHREQRT